MSFFKKPRIQNKKLMKEYHSKECIICGKPATPAHIKGRGAFGDDVPENMAPLCGIHHTEQGQCGMTTFSRIRPTFKQWLLDNGWEFEEHLNKWRQYAK
jgi:hypothetical protein